MRRGHGPAGTSRTQEDNVSSDAVTEVLRRASEDANFRSTFEHDPERALHGYDISYAERQALIAGDVSKLQQLGVPEDLSLLAGQYNREGNRTD
jgi:hypothetical protein